DRRRPAQPAGRRGSGPRPHPDLEQHVHPAHAGDRRRGVQAPRPAMKKTLRRPTTESARLYLGLAAVAYVPLILTQRGWVSADTKTYLYLDPARLLSRAWSMWDPSVGLGTVTHQNIGYLWPQGPFYWVFERLGVPDWLA